MTSLDIVKLYEKGYSIDYIVNVYYRDKKKNSNDVVSYLDNRILIIKRDTLKKSDCKHDVEKFIYNYLFGD